MMFGMDMDAIKGTTLWAVGRRLVVTRLALDYQQQELAETMGWGTTRLNNWERGVREPDVMAMADLCDRYGPTMDWIYRGEMSAMPLFLADKIRAIVAQTDSPDQWSNKRRRRKREE